MKPLDSYQRAAVQCDRNAVVSAGAGSGKTTVLAARYVRLITEKQLPVDSILTLTFTRKARAEMYARIYRDLALCDDPFAREQLDRFDTARIQTFDSFCATIARGACHRWGVPPDFSVDEQRITLGAEEIARGLLMEWKGRALVRKLVAAEGFDRVKGELFAHFALHGCSLVEDRDYRQLAQRQIEVMEEQLQTERAEMDELCDQILRIEGEGQNTITAAQGAARSFQALAQGPGAYGAIVEWAQGPDSSIRKPSATSKTSSLVELRELVDPFKTKKATIAALAETLLFKDDLLCAGELFAELADRMEERKRREGVLTFRDAAELAKAILLSDSSIRRYYKEQIRAVMVDEFQDDDEIQKEILYLISEGLGGEGDRIPEPEELEDGKLFFVGDEKQSIYRFRGADVTVFRRLGSELARCVGGAAALDLATNYRSDPGLVDFFNGLFPGVFGSAEHEWEARFTQVVPGSTQTALRGPRVEIHLADKGEEGEDDSLAPEDAEAFAAALRIREGRERGEFAYGDVAVLFRATGSQRNYERAFRLLHIPFSATDLRGLYREAPANDFYALLRLASQPRDRLAYASFLRSPLVGLGDDALAKILLCQDAVPFPESPDPTWFSTEGDRRRFAAGSRIWRDFSKRIDRESHTSLLDRFWFFEGYRLAMLSSPAGAAYLQHYEYLRALTTDADTRALTSSAFLAELGTSLGEFGKAEGEEGAKEQSAGSEGVVRIMTVHKSKGLEFPVVVIASAGAGARDNVNPAPYYQDREYGPVLNLRRADASKRERIPNPFFAKAKEREDELDRAELRRLLYVSATRAERLLIVFGSRGLNKAEREAAEALAGERGPLEGVLVAPRLSADGTEGPAKSFLHLIAEGLRHPAAKDLQFSLFPIAPLSPTERERMVAESLVHPRTEGSPAPFNAFYHAPIEAELPALLTKTTPTALEEARARLNQEVHSDDAVPIDERLIGDLSIEKLISGNQARYFGELCHGILETALSGAPPQGGLEDILEEFEVQDRASILSCARELANGFLSSDLGCRALAAQRRRTEFPFTLFIEPLSIVGRMDLLFEEDERCVIVDFKTDKEYDPSAHIVQLATYRRAAAAFSSRPAESWLFYLRGSAAVLVSDEVDLHPLIGALCSTEQRELDS